jgi:hypothetical protein
VFAGGGHAAIRLTFVLKRQGSFVTTFCTASGLASGGGDGDVAVNAPDPSNQNIPNLAVVSLLAGFHAEPSHRPRQSYREISTGGLFGSSDRSLADFFQIAIDPTSHLINIPTRMKHAGTSVTYFTRQRQQRLALPSKVNAQAAVTKQREGQPGRQARQQRQFRLQLRRFDSTVGNRGL